MFPPWFFLSEISLYEKPFNGGGIRAETALQDSFGEVVTNSALNEGARVFGFLQTVFY